MGQAERPTSAPRHRLGAVQQAAIRWISLSDRLPRVKKLTPCRASPYAMAETLAVGGAIVEALGSI